jgi:subtilisin-like proprotein convertase family protein
MTRSLTVVSLTLVLGVLALAPGSASAATATFRNSAEITIPAQGTASTYPSKVLVRDMTGLVTDVEVGLNGVAHTRPRDVDVLLMAPDSRGSILMSDACGDGDVTGRSWTVWSNGTPPEMGDSCPDGKYRNTNIGVGDLWPGVPDSFLGPLSRYHHKVQNGAWNLYVYDDEAGDSGKIAGGWSLKLTTTPVDTAIPLSGPADPYPAVRELSDPANAERVITDLDVTLGGVAHDRLEDLDLLLVGPHGQTTMLISDACGPLYLEKDAVVFDDETPFPLPAEPSPLCYERVRPTNHGLDDTLPAPAPTGPYGTSLSAFDFTEPNGAWRLYAFDDDGSAGDGYFLNRFNLSFETRPKATAELAEADAQIAEGASRPLTIRRSALGGLGDASVTVNAVPGTAGADDYIRPLSSEVEFAPDEREKTVVFRARSDGGGEPAETFAVTLTDPTGDAVLGGQRSAMVTIPASAGRVGPQSRVKASCAGRPATILGTAARNALRGTRHADVIAALGGNDRVEGLRGNDLVCGGTGRDRLLGGRGRDRLIGGRGRDTCLGGPGRDRISCP